MIPWWNLYSTGAIGGAGGDCINYVGNVKSWNGSSWTEVSDISTTRGVNWWRWSFKYRCFKLVDIINPPNAS